MASTVKTHINRCSDKRSVIKSFWTTLESLKVKNKFSILIIKLKYFTYQRNCRTCYKFDNSVIEKQKWNNSKIIFCLWLHFTFCTLAKQCILIIKGEKKSCNINFYECGINKLTEIYIFLLFQRDKKIVK